MMKPRSLFTTAAFLTVVLTTPLVTGILVEEQDDNGRSALIQRKTQTRTIVENIESLPTLTKLQEALVRADLLDTLRGNGPWTVLMPYNDAFDSLSQDLRAKLFDEKWKMHLQEILKYHVHAGSVSTTDMMGLSSLPMSNGESVTITTPDQRLYFNTAQNVGYTVASNGYGFMINEILMPSFVTTSLQDVALQPSTSIFARLLVISGMDQTLNDPNVALTVLAPSNIAFDQLGLNVAALESSAEGLAFINQIVLYHILPFMYASTTFPEGSTEIPTLQGNTVTILRDGIIFFVNGKFVISPDNLANNGILHELGEVLIPPGTSLPAILVNVIVGMPELSLLANALATANMADTLNGPGPYTVFAPDNNAFSMFPTMQEYMKGGGWILHLQEMLKFHVTNSLVTAADLVSSGGGTDKMLPMLNGESVNVINNGDTVSLSPAVMGSAPVTSADGTTATNGELHVISRMLLPSMVFTTMVDQALANNPTMASLVVRPELQVFVEYLNSNPGLTFFAPSDAALANMLAQPGGSINEILFYHTVDMLLPSNSISPGTTKMVTSIQGGEIRIAKSSNGDLLVNGAAVVTSPDNLSQTGIVHAIDKVLTIQAPPAQPPQQQPPPNNTGGNTEPNFPLIQAACVHNDQCVAEGLTGGNCCPTSDNAYLKCCQANKLCSSNPACAAKGLGGDCCPTAENIFLDCCL